MQTLHQALLLKKLYLLESCGFSYCDPQFLAPAQKGFQSRNASDLQGIIESCKLCALKNSPASFGLCYSDSKLVFITLAPILDAQMRFNSNTAIMLKNIIEKVFLLPLNKVSILSLLKCEIPKAQEQTSIESCMGYFLKQLEFSNAKVLVVFGQEAYAYLTKDGSHYPNVQGKLLRWNHWEVFPTFALQTLVRQPELKLDAHKEFLRLKQLIGDKNV